MTNILQSLSKTVHLSLGIAIILLIGLHFLVTVSYLIDIFLVGCLDIYMF